MGVPKVITLPAPVQLVPALERLGLLNLTVNPFQKTASVTLCATTAAGERVANGASFPAQVSGADYDLAVAPLVEPVLTAILALMTSRGLIAAGATIDDAVQ